MPATQNTRRSSSAAAREPTTEEAVVVAVVLLAELCLVDCFAMMLVVSCLERGCDGETTCCVCCQPMRASKLSRFAYTDIAACFNKCR